LIEREETDKVLNDLPVSKLFGIGPKLEEALNSMGSSPAVSLGMFPFPF